jgi:hypothetical protein
MYSVPYPYHKMSPKGSLCHGFEPTHSPGCLTTWGHRHSKMETKKVLMKFHTLPIKLFFLWV